MHFFKKKLIFLRELLQDFYKLELKNRLPKPEPKEAELIGEFRSNLNRLALVSAGPSWVSFSKRLKIYARFFDPRKFLNWQLIYGTMFMTLIPSGYLQELQSDPQWSTKWLPLAKEDKWGNAVLGDQVAGSSGNILTHIFHLYRLGKATGVDFSKLSLIVEFGGGYGSMCRLARRLGFQGTYILYDLPEFLSLQKFYLGGLGLQADYFFAGKPAGGNVLVNSLADLRNAVSSYGVAESLFIATWSISETPLQTRKQIFGAVRDFEYFMFGFQNKFDNVDNGEYFARLAEKNPGAEWKKEILEEWSGNYLFGKKRV